VGFDVFLLGSRETSFHPTFRDGTPSAECIF
jgi:hypothetical protein